MIRGFSAGLADFDATPSKSMGNCISSCGAWAGPSRGEGPGIVRPATLDMTGARGLLAAVELCTLMLLPGWASISPPVS